jgi:hypothetical protein
VAQAGGERLLHTPSRAQAIRLLGPRAVLRRVAVRLRDLLGHYEDVKRFVATPGDDGGAWSLDAQARHHKWRSPYAGSSGLVRPPKPACAFPQTPPGPPLALPDRTAGNGTTDRRSGYGPCGRIDVWPSA